MVGTYALSAKFVIEIPGRVSSTVGDRKYNGEWTDNAMVEQVLLAHNRMMTIEAVRMCIVE